MRRFLVVGNQTLASKQLERKLLECLAAGPCRFHIVVPATHPRDHLVWTEGSDRTIARRALDAALVRFRAMGADVDGEVGDARPMDAIADVFTRHDPVDEIIISTLHPARSRWVRQDLPHRAARTFHVPVTHVSDRAVELIAAS